MIDYNNDENLLKSSIVEPFFSKNIRYTEDSVYSAKPNKYTDLINNNEFNNILSLIKRQRARGFENYESVSIKLKDLIDAINSELKNRT